jgi:hypothetical protein
MNKRKKNKVAKEVLGKADLPCSFWLSKPGLPLMVSTHKAYPNGAATLGNPKNRRSLSPTEHIRGNLSSEGCWLQLLSPSSLSPIELRRECEAMMAILHVSHPITSPPFWIQLTWRPCSVSWKNEPAPIPPSTGRGIAWNGQPRTAIPHTPDLNITSLCQTGHCNALNPHLRVKMSFHSSTLHHSVLL